MKTFVAYRFSGEDPKALEPLLVAVRDALKDRGVESYCSFFDEGEFQKKSLGARQIMEHAFRIIDESDFLFVLQTSDNKSEGMLMEVGYCIAKGIPIIVATKDEVASTYLPEMTEIGFKWKDTEDLIAQIRAINLEEIKKLPRF